MSGVNNLYEFGRFRFDAESKTLWHNEEMISLPPKALDVLFMLLENEGKLVSKQEILQIVWADTFVEEGVLTQNIYKLRNTLGTDENGKQYIENIARRGYRFAAPLKVLNADEAAVLNVSNTNIIALNKTDINSRSESFVPNLTASTNQTDNPDSNFTESPLRIQSQTDPETRPRSVFHTLFFVGLGILVMTAISFGVYQFTNRSEEKSESKIAPIEQLRFQRLTDSGDVVFPTISPNGEMLAFVRLEDDEGSVWVKQIATDNSVRILPSSRKGYRSLTFSPDGKNLYYREEADGSAIYQTSLLGGASKKIAVNVWSDFGISPDGKQLVFIRRDTVQNRHLLILSNIESSGERELSAKKSPEDFRSTPGWSPDGSKIAVASGVQSQFFPKLLIIDIADGTEKELKIPRWRAIPRIVWMPNGKYLIISARKAKEPYSQLWMYTLADGQVRRLTNDLEAYFWISLSADGQMVVTRQQRIFSHLWLLPDGDLKKAKQITFGGRNLDGYVGLTWSLDGKVVFSAFANNVTDLYSMNADGTNRVQLIANAGQDNNFPSFSRDGRFIVFVSNRSGTTEIWRMDNDGRNQKQLTFGEESNVRVHSPALSADGTEIFFIKRGAGQSAIWRIPAEGGTATQVSRLTNAAPEDFVAISPDGKQLAYHHVSDKPEASGEDRLVQIGVLPTDGNSAPQLFNLPMRRPFVQWTSGNGFDFAAGKFNSSTLWRQSLDGGEPQKLLDFPDRIFNFAWSPDGKNLVVARGKQQGDAILITNLP